MSVYILGESVIHVRPMQLEALLFYFRSRPDSTL